MMLHKSSVLTLVLRSKMKFFLIFFFYIFFFLNLNVLANDKIVFLDLNYVLKESKYGQQILKELEVINEKNLKIIDKEAFNLQNKEQEIIKLKNILSTDEFNNKINLFKLEVKEHNQNKEKIIEDFEKIKQDKLNFFFENLNKIMNKYMVENSINLIIDKKNVIMSQDNNDISKEILNLVNNYE